MRVVISQPMYFPWLGQLNQAFLADAFVFYSDVQFARGFINRVQVLVDGAQEFITVPTVGSKRCLINQLEPDSSQHWQKIHSYKIKRSFGNTPYFELANNLFESVVKYPHKDLAALSSASVKSLCEHIFPLNCPQFYDSTQFPRTSKSTQALLDICKELGASHYLTGHGAQSYIDSKLFKNEGIELEFIEYNLGEYPQHSGKHLTSYVSSLDAIARIGAEQTLGLLNSKPISAVNFLS